MTKILDKTCLSMVCWQFRVGSAHAQSTLLSKNKCKKAGKKDLTELVPSWYTGPIMRNREDNMKLLRFTVEKNYSERDSEWFYDVVDHHLLRDRRVVGYYSAEPSWEGDTNYGHTAAKEMADDLNDKYGWEYALEKRMNLKEAS